VAAALMRWRFFGSAILVALCWLLLGGWRLLILWIPTDILADLLGIQHVLLTGQWAQIPYGLKNLWHTIEQRPWEWGR
jgi:hypothetical protein